MDRSNVLTLVSETYNADNYGIQQVTTTSRTVFCDVSSVSLAEWSEGGRIGLNPSLRFSLFSYDYADEELCIFNGVQYHIYRTYFGLNDTIELYAEKRMG